MDPSPDTGMGARFVMSWQNLQSPVEINTILSLAVVLGVLLCARLTRKAK
jgi:hypothetical protein